jgi:maltooligosyltrehalose trehalohydrolase
MEGTDFRLRYGARPNGDGRTEFRVWAPRAERLSVKLGGREVPLAPEPDGTFAELVDGAPAGTDYIYVLEAGGVRKERPDPVSRHQPADVHGPSRVVDPDAFSWTDGAWRGIALEAYVTYEAHIGTFTPEGTFDAAIGRLPHLRALGATALELMPVAEFPGGRNWGYDGVDLYAPESSYGGPEGLKRLVDACHAAGLAVVLDVVYNHLGPEGNYLADFGPYFTDRYRTPWGAAVNYDGPGSDGVRRTIVENALYWLVEYHVDALRLDAIHGIFDFSARHILAEIAAAFHDEARRLGRAAYVIAESDLNDVRVIRAPEQGGYGIDAQWTDDFHHALHAVLGPLRRGYFADFGRVDDLAKALAEGFVYDGRYSAWRGRRHGSSSAAEPGRRHVVFIQNHDQVANAYGGERIASALPPEERRLAAALLVCAPYLPLIFMGEEYAETAPFLYFTSHGDPALAAAVREGRAKEHADFQGGGAPFVDPQSEEAFLRSKLRWDRLSQPGHAAALRLYQDLLALRRREPALSNCRKDLTRVQASDAGRWLVLDRRAPGAASALLVCNLGRAGRAIPVRSPGGATARDRWRLALWTGDPRYGGDPDHEAPPPVLVFGNAARLDVPLSGTTAAIYLRSDA